jgi:glycosyltransferase involved in cell wall biosynthesis
MRIVIDLQAAQAGSLALEGASGDTGTPASLALASACDLARCAGDHELWIVLNGALPQSIAAIRAALAMLVPRERILVFAIPAPLAGNPARRQAAAMLREHFIAMLAPDRVLISGPCAASDAIISVEELAPNVPTAFMVHDAASLADGASTALLRRCALVLASHAAAPAASVALARLKTGASVVTVDSGAAILAALAASAPAPAPVLVPGLRIALVAEAGTVFETRLARHGVVQRIAPREATTPVLQKMARACDVLIYQDDTRLDTAVLLSLMEQTAGVLMVQSMAPRTGTNAQTLFDAHGFPALVHPNAPWPGNLALLQAASTVLVDSTAVLAAAQRAYGPAATRDWLLVEDDPGLLAALTRLCRAHGQGRIALLSRLAHRPAAPLEELAYCLAQIPDPLAPRQLLVDVTAIVRHDLKTGIERVVRAQLLDLLRRENVGLRVEPVYLSDRGGRWHFRYARAYALRLLGLDAPALEDAEVDAGAGDIYYSADYSPHVVAAAGQSGLFEHLRARGVAINFVVYDLLPVLHPEFFPSPSAQIHANWLGTVARHADRLLCISAAVRTDMAAWLARQGSVTPQLLSLHLGADLDEEQGIAVVSTDDDALPGAARAAPAFLMVGTIEPRKGHLQALDAFEQLWAAGVAVNLVIIGHEGWRSLPDNERRTIPTLVSRLERHPQRDQRLFWLRGPSDAVLRQAYAECACLLAASEGEGFGLPLIEAARYGLPVLARALPVFQEVAGEHASYFEGTDAASLAMALKTWLADHAQGCHRTSHGMPWQTWHANVDALLAILQRSESATSGRVAPGL